MQWYVSNFFVYQYEINVYHSHCVWNNSEKHKVIKHAFCSIFYEFNWVGRLCSLHMCTIIATKMTDNCIMYIVFNLSQFALLRLVLSKNGRLAIPWITPSQSEQLEMDPIKPHFNPSCCALFGSMMYWLDCSLYLIPIAFNAVILTYQLNRQRVSMAV